MTVKSRIFFITCFIFTSMLGWADVDIDTQDIGSEQIKQPAKRTPHSFNTYVDVVAPTKISKGDHKGQKVHFAVAEVEGGTTVYYCPEYTEGARIGAGYTATYLRWAQNPWFDQSHFDTVSFTLTGFTKRIENWFWRSQLTANIDSTHWNASYISYDIVLWGRYDYSENIGVHLGFLAQTGLRLDRVYPIFGFDWKISDEWKLNVVFPMNISLIYKLSPRWSIAVAGRNFDSRFRAHHKEIFPRALVRYTNIGAEFAVRYDTQYVSANIHAGTTFGGRYRVANRNNHHAHTYDLDSAAYVGAEMDVSF